MDFQKLSAISSGISAALSAVAAWQSRAAARQSVRSASLAALDGRFAQINHARIAHPELWTGIEAEGPISAAENQMIFELFMFYQQAYLYRGRKLISRMDGDFWMKRMTQDLQVLPKYRAWWSAEATGRFSSAWDPSFLELATKAMNENAGRPRRM